jgi:mono/diheme cytochrome c family protein/glucose/arabinose dehydrogenase
MTFQLRPLSIAAVAAASMLSACQTQRSPRAADTPPEVTKVAHVHTVEEALASFRLPEGYHAEVVAYEPMVEDPVAIDFDADGRMYVAEMRGYMPGLSGEGEDQPNGRIVILEDSDDDGLMDRRTVFMDSLVLPRAVKVLEHGVLVAATPNLWIVRDTDGDLQADSVELLRDDYGSTGSNPEHNANGLLWGIDNWIHNANFAGEFRLRPDGGFDFRETPSEGQWGVSMDDYGRLFRNSNSDPLRADLIPAHYATRNTDQASMRGVYERLTPNVAVWPARPTPAVNRGYQPGTLRDDSTLAQYTAAGSPTAYVGDRLPGELKNNVFVTESSGNLVGRFVVEEGEDGLLSARPADDDSDFMTSTDQRFRPVNMTTAPDGTLYVVDMYRGIIQHRVYVTGYLEDQIQARQMEQPVGLGRIYRIVHESTERDDRPRLSERTPAELVEYLAHPNGWWRMTAQRLIVERRDRSVAPALREMARDAENELARLHALWTLEGLGDADAATLIGALADPSSHLRAAAVRIAEPQLADAPAALRSTVLRLADDPSPQVRRQVAASLGELPVAEREPALARIAAEHGDDPIVADLVVSGVAGRELRFLEALISDSSAATGAVETVRALAATIVRGRDAASIQRVVALASEEARPRSHRIALLQAMRPAGGGRGGGAFGGRGGGGARIELPSVPHGLLSMADDNDPELRALAAGVAEVVSWPGKPRPAGSTESPPLDAEEQRLLAMGEEAYATLCAACHQGNGEGLEGVAKSLVGSTWALANPPQVIRIVLHGKEGEMLMPPLGGSMTDEQVAAVLTYVRQSWGNEASPISVEQVAEARGEAGNRRQAWTEEELGGIRR